MASVTKAADLRGSSNDELSQFVKDKGEELFRLRFQHATGQLENVARLKQVRREIARAHTVLTEKKRSEA